MDDMVSENILAVIPARGGSTRIPKKNILPLGGKPLIAWSIDAALASGCFCDVLVSTDDEEIAAIARSFGTSVPFLRNQYADAHSPVSLAVLSALLDYEKLYPDKKVEHVALLQPTCPFRNAHDICHSVAHYFDKKPTALLSCFEFVAGSPWWACTLAPNGNPVPLFPEQLEMRSQDLPALFCPSGAIGLIPRETLVRELMFDVEGYIFYPLSWKSAFDIDTLEEFALAEKLL